MSQDAECGNCGDPGGVTPCVTVWGRPHTHPVAFDDLTPQDCTMFLCRGCVRTISRNLTRRKRAT